jgi:hypothetical protein
VIGLKVGSGIRAVSGGSNVKRIVFALAMGIGAFAFASTPVIADAPAPGSQPVVTAPGTPVVVTATSDVYTPAPARRGLFARIRDRRNANNNMVTYPAPVVPVSPAPTAAPTPVPTPMPTTVSPIGGVVTGQSGVTTANYTATTRTGLFSRIRNRRSSNNFVPMTTIAPMPTPVTTPMSAVVPASGITTATTPAPTSTPVAMTSTTTTRMGLLARIRARRAN